MRAKTSASPARASGSAASGAGSGTPGSTSFAWFDRESSSWRTWQRSLAEGCLTYSGSLPKSGTMQSGRLSKLPKWALRIDGIGCSSSPIFPTPCATDHTGNKSASKGAAFRPSLHTMARKNLWPTPTTGAALCKWGGAGARQMMRNAGVSETELNGALNPAWVEALMGFPPGWTDGSTASIE